MDCQFCNAIRPGISLYGYYPSEYVQQSLKVHLKPSVQLIANVVQTKTLQSVVGHGGPHNSTHPTNIHYRYLLDMQMAIYA